MIDERINSLADKTEYYAVDVFRIIAALAVMTIHIPLFADMSSELSYWQENVLARLAVPFFLMTTGYLFIPR